MKALLVSLIACVASAPLPSAALERPSADAMEAPANADEAILTYQRRLDELLRLDDFEGARSLVETAARALAADERHSSTISAMYKQVRDKRVQEIEDYTTQIKEAVSKGAKVLKGGKVKIIGKATFFEPHQHADGIEHVLVNGAFVVEGGEILYRTPGKIITSRRNGPPAVSDRP